jgi:hypothetical protein
MGDTAGIGVHAADSTAIFLMRSLILAMMMTSGLVSAAWGAQPGTLDTLHAIHTLTKAEAREALLVAFEATVTYYDRTDVDLFVQDGSEAIYVKTKPNEDLVAGDRVFVLQMHCRRWEAVANHRGTKSRSSSRIHLSGRGPGSRPNCVVRSSASDSLRRINTVADRQKLYALIASLGAHLILRPSQR